MSTQDKDIHWISSSLEDLSSFPLPVKKEMGYALRAAQQGERHEGVVTLRGYDAASVLEIKDDYDTNTYRVMYTVEFAEGVYVLMAFMKKSTSGIGLSKRDERTLKARLKMAVEAHEEFVAAQEKEKKSDEQGESHQRQRERLCGPRTGGRSATPGKG